MTEDTRTVTLSFNKNELNALTTLAAVGLLVMTTAPDTEEKRDMFSFLETLATAYMKALGSKGWLALQTRIQAETRKSFPELVTMAAEIGKGGVKMGRTADKDLH